MLNSKYVADGVIRHSPETIQAIKDSLGSGIYHHSYGIRRTVAQKRTNMLGSVNRLQVYVYDLDFIYTGICYESIKETYRCTGVHNDQITRYIDTYAVLNGYRYSTSM